MIVRELTAEEIDAIPDSFYQDTDKLKLGVRYRRDMAIRPVGAFEGKRLIGLWIVSLQVHCGPLWVERSLRGNSHIVREQMWDEVSKVIHEAGAHGAMIIHLDSEPAVGHIVERLHGRRMQGDLYHVEV